MNLLGVFFTKSGDLTTAFLERNGLEAYLDAFKTRPIEHYSLNLTTVLPVLLPKALPTVLAYTENQV